jgi:hypothetical protein
MMASLRILVVAGLALAAGCFRPTFSDQLACGPGGECPPGLSCGDDDRCHGSGGGGSGGSGHDAPEVEADARVDAAADARPDATPVGCQSDDDCKTVPDHCSAAGTCDLGNHVCVFPAIDCSGQADTCNVGGCDPAIGCIKVPAHETATCGAGTTCGAYGACGGSTGVCDATGSQSAACTKFTCQAGACAGTGFTDTRACTLQTPTSCGGTTVSNCGGCFPDTTCSLTGTMTCTCTEMLCMNDACTAVPTSCPQACSVNTDGRECDAIKCGPNNSGWQQICCLGGTCNDFCGGCTF